MRTECSVCADAKTSVHPFVGGLHLASAVALCCAQIAAFLVELFPTKIRYTSMSPPYPIGIAAMTFVVGSVTIRESKDHGLVDDA